MLKNLRVTAFTVAFSLFAISKYKFWISCWICRSGWFVC